MTAAGTIERTMPIFDATLGLQRKYIDLMARAWLMPFETMNRMAMPGPRMSSSRNMVRIDADSSRNEEIIQVGEEVLQVGKRIEKGDTTRVIRTVIESPVEQHVELITQTVVVERRRPTTATASATNVLSERSIAMTSTTERPVVSKTARLVEEVILRREATATVETIRDTVKRDHIAVEQPNRLPAVIAQRDERSNGDARDHNQGQGNRDSREKSSGQAHAHG